MGLARFPLRPGARWPLASRRRAVPGLCLLIPLLLLGCGSARHDAAAPAGDDGAAAALSLELGDREVRVLAGGELVTALHYQERWDKPFLYPLRTASGLTVSRGYPLEPRDGEERDHDWHRGLWYGHGDISGHDFWRELGRDRTGMIVPLSDPALAEDGDSATIAMRFGLRPADGELIGSLHQRFTISMGAGTVRIDAAVTLAADRGAELRIGDTEDGGFAVRLDDAFRQENGAALLNADGLSGTESIWGAAARWVDYSAEIGGQPAGVAILDHPGNLRHPARWHARGYSLCSANPFGLRDFTGNAAVDGSYVVARDSSLTLRYRVIVHEGPVTRETVDRWFDEYAAAQPL